MSSDILTIGKSLKIPTTTGATEVTPPTTQAGLAYTVKSGDTLYSIAKKFNTTVDNIMQENNLNSSMLSINQVLKIPGTSTKTHVVVKGDTLYQIARKYNTTVDAIKKLNNITSNILTIGTILYIP